MVSREPDVLAGQIREMGDAMLELGRGFGAMLPSLLKVRESMDELLWLWGRRAFRPVDPLVAIRPASVRELAGQCWLILRHEWARATGAEPERYPCGVWGPWG
jgi:hypothetical protein